MSNRRQPRPWIILHLRQRELGRLYRHRHGVNELEILALIERDFGGADPLTLTARQAGERCKLTTDERDRLGIRSIKAFDKTDAEAKAHYRARRRERDRLGRRRRRHQQRQNRPADERPKIDQRMDKIGSFLCERSQTDPKHWYMVTEITAAVKKSRAFTGLSLKSARVRIHEALHRMAAAGAIEIDTAWTDVREVLLARWCSKSPAFHGEATPKQYDLETQNVASQRKA